MTRIGSAWRRHAAVGCAALLGVLLAGCGSSNSNGNVSQNTGFLRSFNAVPDSPTLLAGLTVATPSRVSFAQSSALSAYRAGKYTLKAQYVDATGTVVGVISVPVQVQRNQQVAVFMMGSLAMPTTKVVRNPIPDIAAGDAEFQVVHAASGQSTLDVYLTDANAPLAGATPITLAYENASDLMTVSASASLRLRVTPPGDNTTILYDSGEFPLASQARGTFVLVDYFGPGGNGFRAVQLTNVAAAAFPNEVLPGALRVANMIANETAVDVYIGGTGGAPTFANVPFGTIDARQQFAAGTLDVTVTPPNTPGTVLFNGTVSLNPGESRTLVFALSGSAVVGRFALDNTRPISVLPQLQTVQASPSSGAVDVYLLTAGQTVNDVAANLVNLPLMSVTGTTPGADSYDVEVTANGDKTVVVGPVPIVLDNAGIYTMYLSDAPGGGLPAQLVLGDDFN